MGNAPGRYRGLGLKPRKGKVELPAKFYYRDDDAPAPKKIGVGALALIKHDGRLLLELRSDCGLWGLPGGAVEPDEDIGVALRREVLEETNLSITEVELFGIYTDATRIAAYPDGNVLRLVSFVYRCSVPDVARMHPSEESLELRFFDRPELPTLDIVATAEPIIADFLSS